MSGGSKQACLGYNYARNIGYMEGIVVNILSRLPVKHILDCKLVSKFWHRLIDEPQFAQLHFNCSRDEQKYIVSLNCGHAEPEKKLYLMDKNGEISPYDTLPSLDGYSSCDLICSFNGLLCFTKSLGVEGTDLDIYICNPLTRKVLKLPKGSPSTKHPSIKIIFDPNKNKYKVLRSFCVTNETATKYEIYSPGDVDWRVIDGLMDPTAAIIPRSLLSPRVCVGGRMYWLSFSGREYMPDHIISVDMDENIIRIKLPEKNSDESEKNLYTFLIEHKGRLGVVDIDDDDDETEVSFWILKNPDESSWENRKSAVHRTDHCINGIYSIVSLESKVFLVSSKDGHIFHLPNLDEKTCRLSEIASICEECNDGEFDFSCVLYGVHIPLVFPFSESLFRCDASN